ncbi:Hypothetical predicted protein [Pelobates cultripes]|uniref:Uncharacterized protein n=1 Tax=Pelobates cultripes TaxID=61616 RepID=A0AAD1SCF3_PELCU|nr:Hypothetical predicted protein [Pelobates cultripes]
MGASSTLLPLFFPALLADLLLSFPFGSLWLRSVFFLLSFCFPSSWRGAVQYRLPSCPAAGTTENDSDGPTWVYCAPLSQRMGTAPPPVSLPCSLYRGKAVISCDRGWRGRDDRPRGSDGSRPRLASPHRRTLGPGAGGEAGCKSLPFGNSNVTTINTFLEC